MEMRGTDFEKPWGSNEGMASSAKSVQRQYSADMAKNSSNNPFPAVC